MSAIDCTDWPAEFAKRETRHAQAALACLTAIEEQMAKRQYLNALCLSHKLSAALTSAFGVVLKGAE